MKHAQVTSYKYENEQTRADYTEDFAALSICLVSTEKQKKVAINAFFC